MSSTAADHNDKSKIKDGMQTTESSPRVVLESIEAEAFSPGVLAECGNAIMACCDAFFSSCNEVSCDVGSLDCNCDCNI